MTTRRFSRGLPRALAASSLVLAALAVTPAQAVTYTEIGDAGALPGTAQGTGSGALDAIAGTLLSGTDADLFLINITNAATFSATTVGAGTETALDTQLFLFTGAGNAVVGNDDDAGGLSLQSTLPAGSANAFGPVAAGLYLVGVSVSGYDPVNAVNQQLFDSTTLSFELKGPNRNATPTQLAGFFSLGTVGSGAYTITLTGAVAAVPEPATALLAGVGALALLGAAARRRRA